MATLVNESFKISERKLISVFVTPVLWAVLLNGIVGQVHKVIIEVGCGHRVRLTRSAQVALFEKVHIHIVRQRYPDPDVKLTLFD